MRLRYRIILVVCSVLLFALLAPAAVFFARGYYIDFIHRKIIKTGVLVVKTDPRGAQVFLSNQKIKDTPSTNRFVFPGEYDVSVKKSGYRTWKKRITIHEQVVTSLPDSGKIFLLRDVFSQTLIATSTLDFFPTKDGIFFLENQKIELLNPDNEETKIVATTTLLLTPKILEGRGGQEILISGQGHNFYASPQVSFQIPQNLKLPKLGQTPGEILALNEKDELVKLTVSSQKIEIIRETITDFAIGNSIYYISGLKLLRLNNNSPDELISSNLPTFSQSKIILTPTNQIFLILDGSLYEVSETLKKINDSVEYATWDENLQGLIYGNSHEVWIYPLETLRNSLITRSFSTLGQAIFNEKIGYVFVAEGAQIKAIEFDPLNEPNVYVLSQTETPASKLFVSSDGSKLFYLDGQNLYSLKIR